MSVRLGSDYIVTVLWLLVFASTIFTPVTPVAAFAHGETVAPHGAACAPAVSPAASASPSQGDSEAATVDDGRHVPGTRAGSYSGATNPVRLQTAAPHRWSNGAQFDLTDDDMIPYDATVTGITIHYDRSAGRFSLPHLAIFDEDGRCFYVNDLNRRTAALNGQPVRQRWRIQFWTESIWAGPARIWPRVTITYVY